MTDNNVYSVYFIHDGAEMVCCAFYEMCVQIHIRRAVDGAVLRTFSLPKYTYTWNALVPCDGDTAVLTRDAVAYAVMKCSLRDGVELERYTNVDKLDRCCGCLQDSVIILWNMFNGVSVRRSFALRCTWVRCVGLFFCKT